MSDKIAYFDSKSVSVPALLHQILGTDAVEALVVCVRIDGKWNTTWTSGCNLGSLAMASMKLAHDVTARMHEDGE